uniref:Uncharacterized protein n=1 Tax=Lotharella globosa TaxID=91324 RepID=A0A6U3BYN3_9EUKA|mmetsp:Transcript_21842/g.43895  ORF Transcript_21842/g.43895 Transcript_21842/m.43895 type:complete len:184 (+) Transcript_21842:50-601(+)|eukprot:CAMPEP_0167815646 /NCGR_PEP_ID=MMETSP0112_2-20121227/3141_1 /TAXON_ID=91324 /ORGANISM="Lotharella globosa, Strain CCCM811" /LENGTH=183 /DNA_ID=CAMNT_0007715095 /DNA_START=1 /DNA_END=552 /DNA_ORIENTATION=+
MKRGKPDTKSKETKNRTLMYPETDGDKFRGSTKSEFVVGSPVRDSPLRSRIDLKDRQLQSCSTLPRDKDRYLPRQPPLQFKKQPCSLPATADTSRDLPPLPPSDTNYYHLKARLFRSLNRAKNSEKRYPFSAKSSDPIPITNTTRSEPLVGSLEDRRRPWKNSPSLGFEADVPSKDTQFQLEI